MLSAESKIKNKPSIECLTCFNESYFEIDDVMRTGRKSWAVRFRCPYCFTGMVYQFEGFAFYDRLLKHLKKLVSHQRAVEKPTSYREWDLRTGKVYRDSHPDGIYEEIII